PVETKLLIREISPDRLRRVLDVGGTNGFVRVLGLLLLLADILVRLGWKISCAQLGDKLTHIRNRVGADAGRIGTHVGDQTDRTFISDLNTLIEPLGDSHRAADIEAQPSGSLLL